VMHMLLVTSGGQYIIVDGKISRYKDVEKAIKLLITVIKETSEQIGYKIFVAELDEQDLELLKKIVRKHLNGKKKMIIDTAKFLDKVGWEWRDWFELPPTL